MNTVVDTFPYLLGPIGLDGKECPVHCPAPCNDDEMMCYGGKDWNGCPHQDFCNPKAQCAPAYFNLNQKVQS